MLTPISYFSYVFLSDFLFFGQNFNFSPNYPKMVNFCPKTRLVKFQAILTVGTWFFGPKTLVKKNPKKAKNTVNFNFFDKNLKFTVFFEKKCPQPPFFSKIFFHFTKKFRDFKNAFSSKISLIFDQNFRS